MLKCAGEQAFVSDADISQFKKARSSPETNAHYENINKEAVHRSIACAKPTIAIIIGGGLAIAIGCDIRVAADNAKLAFRPLAWELDTALPP